MLGHVAHYRRLPWRTPTNPWLPTLVALEQRRGPLPGLAELIRSEAAAALGEGGLPEIYRELAVLPVLDLARRP